VWRGVPGALVRPHGREREDSVPASNGRAAQRAVGVPAGLEIGLRNYWYPVVASAELTDRPIALTYLNEKLVAWRGADGLPHVFQDYCPHRGVPLSIGEIAGNNIQCIFHGLQYDGTGRCAFMPWEDDDSPELQRIHAQAYPTQEQRGLVFAYLGDTERFPAPPLRGEIPLELFDDDYVGYTLTHIWDCNWLLAVDQADRFHVPFLHAEFVVPAGGAPTDVRLPRHGADGRRIKVTKTDTGVLDVAVLDPMGNPIFSGQRADPEFDTEGFYLPALNCLSVAAARGGPPHHIYLWMIPIDESHTRVTRIVQRKAITPDEKVRWDADFHEVVGPRTMRVSDEDAMLAATIPSLEFARDHEHLFFPDGEIVRRRVSFNKVYREQKRGYRYPAVRTPI
jgi:phenylpropionate dioxygenase-like ring-hydroxylating dioxygenase large terminal subunit